MMIGGFGIYQHAVAATGEIGVLQPMFGVSSATLAVCAVVLLRERFSRLEWVALTVMLVGLAVLGTTAERRPPAVTPVGLAVGFAIFAAVLLSVRDRGVWLARFLPLEFVLGAGGGLLQGLGLIFVAVFGHEREAGGAVVWQAALLACALACFVGQFACLQGGVQVGRAMVVVTLNGVVTNLVAIGGGMSILGQALPADARRAALQLGSVVAVVVASAVLARRGATLSGATAPAVEAGEPTPAGSVV
jgi:hypothetical protein